MPTLVNNLRAIRGPVTAVPVTAGSGIEIAADTQNNQIVISANLEAGSGIEIVDDNGKAKIINSDNAQALPIVAGSGVKLTVVNNQVVVSADETVLYTGTSQTTSFNLSESPANFKQLRIKFDEMGTGLRFGYMYCNDPSLASIGAVGLNFFTNDATDSVHIDSARFAVNSNALTMNYAQKKWLSLSDNSQTSQSFGAASILSNIKIYEIVGINRIANN